MRASQTSTNPRAARDQERAQENVWDSARERGKQLLETAQDLGETEASLCTGGVRLLCADPER